MTGATQPVRLDPLGPLPDDVVLPFRAEATGVMGRLARLGPSADEILTRHGYPEPVTLLLGRALALSAMLGAALQEGTKFILQTRTDGPVGCVVATCESPGRLRGYASFDKAALAALTAAAGRIAESRLIGSGHLAMTIDPGGDLDRHQGIVELDGQSLDEAALIYFRRSVQLPTFIRLAVARHYTADGSQSRGWHWRVGGLMVQHLSPEGGSGLGERGTAGGDDHDENWERTRILAASVEDHELLDPLLKPDRLLWRLFHEEGVRAYHATPLVARCTCSRERLARILGQFGAEEVREMVEADGLIKARCEFCNASYDFSPEELLPKA